MGFIWQNTGSSDKDLEGIMELVNYMENKMRCTQLSIPGQAKEDEEDQENLRPINRKEFRDAIQSLQTLINNLSDQINKD
eukprot:11702384-Heterocapsa_arctica.AAC.1